jgi:uncharacterized heparinase superfamily protein
MSDGPADQDRIPERPLWRGFLDRVAEELREAPTYRLLLRGPVPEGLLARPRPMLAGDPERGREILAGRWWIGRELHRTAALTPTDTPQPWDNTPGEHFTLRLHRFEWLSDITACGVDAQAVARRLVEGWVEDFGEWNSIVWRPEVTAARVIAWLENPNVIDGQSSAMREKVLDSLARQVRHLMRSLDRAATPDGRMQIAAAAAMGELALWGREGRHAEALSALEHATMLATLADGGHTSRAPGLLAHRLAECAEVDELTQVLGVAPSPALFRRMEIMASTLRSVLTPTGGVPSFNGGPRLSPERVKPLVARFEGVGRSYPFTRQFGFYRLRAGELTVLVDTLGAPEGPAGLSAHAGCLGVEVYAGGLPLMTSCGSHPDLDAAYRQALRMTAAHTTLDLRPRASAEFEGEDGRGQLTGPADAYSRYTEDAAEESLFECGHSGWRQAFGLGFRRRMKLERDGSRVRFEDAVFRPSSERGPVPSRSLPFAVRLHLNPAVVCDPADEGDTQATLGLPDGSSWRLRTRLPIAFAESVWVGPNGFPFPTTQIVLAGEADPVGDGNSAPNQVLWSLQRV